MQINKTWIVVAAAASAWGQAPQGMTARDMFYSVAGLAAPAKPKGARPASGPARRPPAPKPSEVAKKTAPPTVVNPPGPPGQAPAPAPGPGPGPAGDPQVILAAHKLAPLGLRYSILKEERGGAAVMEVDADTVFRSGDRIRVAAMANDRAHLYIVLKGSSGNWSVLFPSAEINGGNNVIEKERTYDIPAGHWFAFDQQPGKETLFLVVSRKPEPDLERMMYRLREGQAGPPAATPQPGGDRPAKVLMAMDRPIDDALVSRVRSQVFARDLVFEKVDDKTPGERKEKAVYVVNKTGAEESRVVADVTLNHQ